MRVILVDAEEDDADEVDDGGGDYDDVDWLIDNFILIITEESGVGFIRWPRDCKSFAALHVSCWNAGPAHTVPSAYPAIGIRCLLDNAYPDMVPRKT